MKICALSLLLACHGAAGLRAEDPGSELFEQKIRPVLVEHCYDCHGEKKQKGGLRLDSKAGWSKGGDTGAAITPGNPEKSLLIAAIRFHDKDLQMPPEKAGGKLTPERIADFEAWVKMGAPDPRLGATPAVDAATVMARAHEHWSFKPVIKPAVPAVKDAAWVKTPVDAFILAELQARGMKPAAPADKRTLLRRLYFDLTGLPPSAQDADAFLQDADPQAYARAVDRLLDSPQYGERWGRFWLDIARYADTRGYTVDGEERRFAFSHTYRDYVIRAFMEDKPYDVFVREQIAADRIATGEDSSSLAALGFLTLGRRGTEHDTIDDRIDVVTRGLMALTVTCARCHDHKFDPVPTADYYSLYGVFASSEEPAERPLLGKLKTGPEYEDFLEKRAAIEIQVASKRAELIANFLSRERQKTGDYLLAAFDVKRAGAVKLGVFAGERKLAEPILERWMAFLAERSKEHDEIFAPWLAFAALTDAEFAGKAKELAAKFAANADASKPINVLVAKEFAGAAPGSLRAVAAVYNKVCGLVEGPAKGEPPANARPIGGSPEERIRKMLSAPDAPPSLAVQATVKLLDRELDKQTVPLRKQISALDWTHPGAPQRAMALVDRAKPVTPRIFLRGNASTPGAPIPRQFLEVLSGPDRKPFANGSGRLDLANAIASRDNPLTGRVFVNRVWGWHLGRTLVGTPGDFGVRTEVPTQIALLNWLSAEFMEKGWSVKKLHRLILLSSTYQQASDADPRYGSLDPENQLVHKFNRHRLDFEAMRDTLLASSGRLDLSVGGLPVDLSTQPFTRRRTVYGFIDRLNLPNLFRTFDFANPDISSPQRFATTVPQQALFMMNSPFVLEQARELVRRPEVERCANDTERLQALYRVLFQRQPEADELQEAFTFLKRQQTRAAQPERQAGWQYGYGWFDPQGNRTKDFKAFAYTDNARRSPAAVYPDPQFGYLALNTGGGHPGPRAVLSSILRWVSPANGHVRVTGVLGHGSKDGDGVRGRVVSASGGKLGEWSVLNTKAVTEIADVEVKVGESLDFVVDCLTSSDFDGYSWQPTIMFLGNNEANLGKRRWEAEKDFLLTGPSAPNTAWDQLAQTLLIGNEMMFVD